MILVQLVKTYLTKFQSGLLAQGRMWEAFSSDDRRSAVSIARRRRPPTFQSPAPVVNAEH